MKSRAGVMCLEGNWEAKLTDRSSVRPLLDVLHYRERVEYIHRDVGTEPELEHYLHKWFQRQYDRYSVGYLSFHGEPGVLKVGRTQVSLERLAAIIDGRGSGRVLHLGSCGTIDVGKKALREFLGQTKLRAVCGFHTDVDWIESAAFELMLLDRLTHYRRIDAVGNWIGKHQGSFGRRLGFQLMY